MPYNIGRVREVAVRAVRPGWRGGRSCGRRDKGHLKRKAEGLQPRTPLLYEDATLSHLSKEKDVKWFDQAKD